MGVSTNAGTPNTWMVNFMENANPKWMMTEGIQETSMKPSSTVIKILEDMEKSNGCPKDQ